MERLRKNRTRILEPEFGSFAGNGNVNCRCAFLGASKHETAEFLVYLCKPVWFCIGKQFISVCSSIEFEKLRSRSHSAGVLVIKTETFRTEFEFKSPLCAANGQLDVIPSLVIPIYISLMQISEFFHVTQQLNTH
jgi:hypothetical protein